MVVFYGQTQPLAASAAPWWMDDYPIDGIFLNMPGYQVNNSYAGKYEGIDQNEYDRKRFFDYSRGKALPVNEDKDDPLYQEYVKFKAATVEEWSKRLYEMVKAKSNQIAICTYSDRYVDIIRQESQNMLTLPYWPYMASDNLNDATHSYPHHIISNASIQQLSFQSRYNAIEPEEVAIRLYENIANGSGLDVSLMGDLRGYEDERNFDVIKKICAFHRAHEAYFGRYRSVAEIAVVAPGPWPAGSSMQEYSGIAIDKPLPVIFDTDMGPDYDDVGAIALLHAYADSGKAHILATMASNKYEGVAAVINVFNTYFHRADIPIGVPKGLAVSERDEQHWTDSILARYPHALRSNSEAYDAVALYRRILAGQADHSVVIITVGFLTNLAGLLQSPPDAYSSLNGEELVRKKVRQLVSMAGKFPEGWEFNVFKDSTASRYVVAHWPTPVLYSGFEIGVRIKCGLPLVGDDAIRNSPVKDVFRISLPQAAEDSSGRSSWDETAVLVGIGGYQPYYTVRHGQMLVAVNGSDRWEDSADGLQAHLVEARPVAEVQAVINALMRHQPR